MRVSMNEGTMSACSGLSVSLGMQEDKINKPWCRTSETRQEDLPQGSDARSTKAKGQFLFCTNGVYMHAFIFSHTNGFPPIDVTKVTHRRCFGVQMYLKHWYTVLCTHRHPSWVVRSSKGSHYHMEFPWIEASTGDLRCEYHFTYTCRAHMWRPKNIP